MKQTVPPRTEVCVNGVYYRAGDTYDDGKKEQKPKPIKKESKDGRKLSD